MSFSDFHGDPEFCFNHQIPENCHAETLFYAEAEISTLKIGNILIKNH